MKRALIIGGILVVTLLLSLFGLNRNPPLDTVEQVDLPRFMGKWYVIASIPTFLEKDIFNATETYELLDGNKVATTFSFNKDSFDGERKTFEPMGFVESANNAIWGMQFLWPIKADYRIIYLDDDYDTTIIGRNKRDYVWIMARTPQINPDTYDLLVTLVDDVGYEVSNLVKVPQSRTN
ncbi:MAG: lipocalin family protein [Pseudomonadota bacterium]